ncbi:unnamed protein product [Nezara viridula]|uniref:Uncharacterized protein n=1 Tax=Nezara viridula TaxID=85310 RepID=A0A9P0HDV9_NEZVI|nr:unnamed protein product [Nezara viridula]
MEISVRLVSGMIKSDFRTDAFRAMTGQRSHWVFQQDSAPAHKARSTRLAATELRTLLNSSLFQIGTHEALV